MGRKFLMYLIGISGSGKTTIANALEEELRKQKADLKLQVIDGDVIRAQFGDIFGYTYEERMKCNRVVRIVVKYLLDNDVSVVLAQVAAYKEMREKMRLQAPEHYIEVYIKCSVKECARRDIKGYYEKQRRQEMDHLNGVDETFETPSNSNIVIDTERESIQEAVEKIMEYLREHQYVL